MRNGVGGVTVRAVNPFDLSEGQIQRINEVSQDIWAEGLGELVQCNCCKKMMSKRDIFGHLAKDIYDRTTSDIMRTLDTQEIPCIGCGGETRFIYGESNIGAIKERLTKSKKAVLVLCENQEGEIVGFEEGYVDSFENIFRRELAFHYKNIGEDEIKKLVEKIIGYNPDEMFVLSSIGFLASYINFFTLFEVLKTFAFSIPEDYIRMPAITELDEGNSLNTVSIAIGCQSLGIQENPILRTKIVDTGRTYKSNLTIVPEVGERYRNFFSKGPKHFLKTARNKIN